LEQIAPELEDGDFFFGTFLCEIGLVVLKGQTVAFSVKEQEKIKGNRLQVHGSDSGSGGILCLVYPRRNAQFSLAMARGRCGKYRFAILKRRPVVVVGRVPPNNGHNHRGSKFSDPLWTGVCEKTDKIEHSALMIDQAVFLPCLLNGYNNRGSVDWQGDSFRWGFVFINPPNTRL